MGLVIVSIDRSRAVAGRRPPPPREAVFPLFVSKNEINVETSDLNPSVMCTSKSKNN
jgi:hypothetical protein